MIILDNLIFNRRETLFYLSKVKTIKTFLLGRKAMTDLDSILKCRDITLSTNVCLVQALVFLIIMYRHELDYKQS